MRERARVFYTVNDDHFRKKPYAIHGYVISAKRDAIPFSGIVKSEGYFDRISDKVDEICKLYNLDCTMILCNNL